ncbi:MAG: biotin/lipoyl-binding protein [Chloroflexi bacterium]|nr:MAG: biotin/lipoyl-binding protein [Chloroflexota bacterium]MBL1193061.1 biotin/lipoyl-binding protein [Chloroflexota bacterium]NOH10354.1 biotin/lipoyl-binding protein [Chloroflexota bacterium]
MRLSYLANGHNHDVDLEKGEGGYRVTVGDSSQVVQVNSSTDGALQLLIDGKMLKAHVAAEGKQRYVWLNGKSYSFEKPSGSARRGAAAEAGGDGILRAPMPGQVRQVLVNEGDQVENGQTLLLLEAMKMEIRIQANLDGKLMKLHVAEGQTVDKDATLLEIEEG